MDDTAFEAMYTKLVGKSKSSYYTDYVKSLQDYAKQFSAWRKNMAQAQEMTSGAHVSGPAFGEASYDWYMHAGGPPVPQNWQQFSQDKKLPQKPSSMLWGVAPWAKVQNAPLLSPVDPLTNLEDSNAGQ